MEEAEHRNYFKLNEFYFLSQEVNESILIGLLKVLKMFEVHPLAKTRANKQAYKIDSFEKLKMDDPLDEVFSKYNRTYNQIS